MPEDYAAHIWMSPITLLLKSHQNQSKLCQHLLILEPIGLIANQSKLSEIKEIVALVGLFLLLKQCLTESASSPMDLNKLIFQLKILFLVLWMDVKEETQEALGIIMLITESQLEALINQKIVANHTPLILAESHAKKNHFLLPQLANILVNQGIPCHTTKICIMVILPIMLVGQLMQFKKKSYKMDQFRQQWLCIKISWLIKVEYINMLLVKN